MMASVANSGASDTDVRLFLQLANPEATSRQQADITRMQNIPDDEDDEEYEDDEEEGVDGIELDEGPAGRDRAPFDEAEEDYEDGEEDGEEDAAEDAGEPLNSPLTGNHDMTQGVNDPLATDLQMSPQELLIEKQSVLLELDRLRAQGVNLTQQFTLDSDLQVMQWEVRRHLMMIDEQNSINFLKDAMRLGFSGIEALNSKAGPLLELDGWAASASQELGAQKYDATLSKLYRKYWKRGSSSPELELAFGILGSAGAYHFRKKFMGSRAAPRRPAQVVDDSDDEEAP